MESILIALGVEINVYTRVVTVGFDNPQNRLQFCAKIFDYDGVGGAQIWATDWNKSLPTVMKQAAAKLGRMFE